jgi:dipeptidyl aminopeptidase/acylaminoacyl peptidase
MPEPRIAPYGSWASPITSDLIVASSIGLGDIILDGGRVYWLESRPQEQGRSVIVGMAADGTVADVTPAGFSVRTRVHEYGGGAWLAAGGIVYFSNDADGRLWCLEPGIEPVPVTEQPPRPRGLRWADGIIDAGRNRMIWVREDHTGDGKEPVNALVAVPLDGGPPQVLAAGADFYAAPRLSPDGTSLAWLEWRHPNMPWDGTELWVGQLGPDGAVASRRKIAGGPAESVFQPEWSPDGILYFVSDRSGWWNLYRAAGDRVEPLWPEAAEFGSAQWGFRMSRYAFAAPRLLVCSLSRDGITSLATLDLDTLAHRTLATEFTEIGSVHADKEHVYFRGASPTRFGAIVRLALGSGEVEILKSSSTADPAAYDGCLSGPEPVAFPTENGQSAYGLFYAPANRDFRSPAGESPPLLVRSHGGPTASASAALDWGIQYWTSRGFAVLDVNYGGSTGYGRAYRERLRGAWGVVDVDDCVNGARHLAQGGRVDGRRMAIRGGSAGGYTTLCALTFRDVFAAGASYYGISDLEALARDTHKFESRYLDGLIGPYPDRQDLYRARSPVHFTDRLGVPIAIFQGAEDAVVPPEQAELMATALRQKGLPCFYLLFDGEQHGFRRAANIKRALDAELYFYSIFLSRTKLMFGVE